MTQRLHAGQFPLSLSYPERKTRGDLIVGASNQTALAWIDRWPEWGGATGLVLVGPSGSGKSHLSHIWCERAQGVIIGRDDLAPDLPSHQIVPRVIDRLDGMVGDRALETILFHLFNQTREQGSSLLFTLQTRPALLNFVLPDLQSRIKSLPCAIIDPPDDAMLAAILRKLSADRQLPVDSAIIDYLVPRMDRSFAGALAVIAQMDRMALGQKRPVTLAVARQVLADGAINESTN